MIKKIWFAILLLFVFLVFSSSPVLAFSGSGAGTSGSPYQITTCVQLEEMANNLSAYYQENNDIDCTGVSLTPIGSSTTPFTGTFNGNNYAISHVTLSGSSGYLGLFGYTSNVTLKNVRLVSGSVNDSGNYTGSLIAYADNNVTVTHSSSQLSVTGNAYTGGLIGYVVGPATLQKV